MTPKAQQALNDPKFYQLPPAEQQKALAMVDKDFGGLPLEERNKVLQMGQQRLGTGSAAAPAPAAPIPSPVTATGSIRPLTDRDRFLDPNLYPVGLKDEGMGENLKNLAQRGGVGIFQLGDMLANPGQTVRGFVSSVLPDPVINLLNKLPGPASGKSHPIPTGAENPLRAAYQAMVTSRGPMEMAGKAAPLAGQALAGDALGVAVPAVLRDTVSGVGSGAEGLARVVTGTGRGPVEDLVKQRRLANQGVDVANIEAQRAYNRKIGETARNNREVTASERAKSDQDARLQVGGSQLIYGLRQLDKALNNKAGVMFDSVRKLVAESKQPPLPGTDLGTAARAALAKVSGSSEIPKPFRDILSKYPESEPETIAYQGAQIPKGHPLYDVLAKNGATGAPPVTFGDLQGYYSETGAELSKGTLPGDVYAATKELHNVIGDMMQKMAKAAGPEANEMFWDSRKFYSGYMDTFHEPTGPSSSGSPVAQALLAKDPLVAADKFTGPSADRGVADLGKYSHSLANLAQDLQRTGEAKITVPARKSMTSAPSLKLDPHQTISAGDITAAKQIAADASAGKWWRRGEWAAAVPIFQAMRAFWGGHIPSIPTMGLESAGVLATARAAAELLRYPPMIRFLTQVRPEDVALIPLDLRGDLPGLVSQAQRQGIKVSPALIAAAAGSGQQNRQSPVSPAQAIQAMQPPQTTQALQGAVQ